ncbi:TPA: hypothetical protein LA462_000468 [Clostridium botulinum]|nr:hypothetical protein [Clostridium botulinum]
MKLTDRDIDLIKFLEENTGATIEQLQLLFFTSYSMAAKRLKKLSDNKYIKVSIHPTLGKKVYYKNKIPSFHTLVITDVLIALKDKVVYMKREYKIKKYSVDCIFILENGQIITIEIDIFNRSTEEKILDVYNELLKTKTDVKIVIVSKHKRRQGKKEKDNKNIINVDIEKVREVINSFVK